MVRTRTVRLADLPGVPALAPHQIRSESRLLGRRSRLHPGANPKELR